MRDKLRVLLALAIVLVLSTPSPAAPGDDARPKADAKKSVAVVRPEPSVRVEGGAALTVAPVPGMGMPDENAISASEAYAFLREAVRRTHPTARLHALQTNLYALSEEGLSSGWSAEFLTDTPSEVVRMVYEDGEFSAPLVGWIRPGRESVPDEEMLMYDTKKLYAEARAQAAAVDPITRITASLYRSAGSGEPLWLLNVYGGDDRIATTVVFDARTLKVKHKTR